MWLAFVFLMGASLGWLLRAVYDERQRTRDMEHLLRRYDFSGDPRTVSDEWRRHHIYAVGKQGDGAA